MSDINVKVTFDKINVKEKIQEHKVKILMLKGEKGDTGNAAWGEITGNISTQTDLQNLLNGKASTESVATNTSDISDLQTSVGTNTSDISSLQTSVGTNTSDISSLQSSVATNTSDISDLQTSVGTNTSDISNLKKKETKTISTGGVSVNLTKIGKLIVLSIFASNAIQMTSGSNINIGTLPDGWKPLQQQGGSCIIKDSNWKPILGAILVRTSGAIELNQASGSTITTAQILANICYFVN